MQLTNYQKLWHSCPECRATATILNQWGDKYAGIWECINPECGASDTCQHENTHTEQAEEWPTDSIYLERQHEIYVCDDCDCTVDLDEARGK